MNSPHFMSMPGGRYCFFILRASNTGYACGKTIGPVTAPHVKETKYPYKNLG